MVSLLRQDTAWSVRGEARVLSKLTARKLVSFENASIPSSCDLGTDHCLDTDTRVTL